MRDSVKFSPQIIRVKIASEQVSLIYFKIQFHNLYPLFHQKGLVVVIYFGNRGKLKVCSGTKLKRK